MQFNTFAPTLKRSLVRILIALCAIALAVLAAVAYARFIEPHWLRIRYVNLTMAPTARLIHISDIHFTGDTQYLQKVVDTINRTEADFVCFTGDMIEEAAFAEGALRVLSRINKPLYGVAGNHDFWSLRSFQGVAKAFQGTGGNWLTNQPVLLPSKQIALTTLRALNVQAPAGYRRVLLEHYPDTIEKTHDARFDLILAGHTHGGQVRIPLMHRFVIPFDIGTYDRGLFQTPCGPLYVNPGIGTYYWNVRFLRRPEITVIGI